MLFFITAANDGAGTESDGDLGQLSNEKIKLMSQTKGDNDNPEPTLHLRASVVPPLSDSALPPLVGQPGLLKPACSWLAPCCRFKPGRWAKIALILVFSCIVLLIMTIFYGKGNILHHWWTICILVSLALAVVLLTASFYAYKQNLNGVEVKVRKSLL